MGFGFNLFVVFILLPASAIGLIVWLLTKRSIVLVTVAVAWIGILGIVLLISLVRVLTSKTILTKDDYYGNYVVMRDYFPGKQADWQYNTFRFEIRDNDSIYFHVTDGEKIVRTYRGFVDMTAPYRSIRLKIAMNAPTHHIVLDNPTTYRGVWSFYLVFNSPKFGNVFFEKGDWKSLKEK